MGQYSLRRAPAVLQQIQQECRDLWMRMEVAQQTQEAHTERPLMLMPWVAWIQLLQEPSRMVAMAALLHRECSRGTALLQVEASQKLWSM